MQKIRGETIRTLFSESEIQSRVETIAGEVADLNIDNLLVVSILKGSFVFAADLIRAFHAKGISPEVEFISISSYGSGTEAGELKILRDLETPVKGRTVVLIDDILESGNTLQYTRDLMHERDAADVKIIVLLDKLSRRKQNISADYVGFECPDKFVVGYGMDKGHAFRELPFVGEIVEES